MAPFLFGMALQRWGAGALWLSLALGLSAFAALLLLPRARPAGVAVPAALTRVKGG